MRFIFLSAFLLSGLVAQNATVYPSSPSAPANTPVQASANAASTPPPAEATASSEAATDTSGVPTALPGETQYTVMQGDSLWKISRKFKVQVDDIKSLNQLPNNLLHPGQVLRIPPKPAPKPKPLSAKDKAAQKALADKTAPAVPVAVTPPPPPPPTLQERFTNEIKQIASNKIAYNHSWIPPGEREPWLMDCSNTTRWLYKKVQGFELDRTASDQYDHLMKLNQAWLVPMNNGVPDLDYLDKHLQTGDLLFWENTYKPDRQPPITHVTLYLGKDDQGRMLMAGSQTTRGLYNPAGNGPDVYIFDPLAPTGGYNTGFFGWTHVKGDFVAFGRPIDTSAQETPVIAPTTTKAPN